MSPGICRGCEVFWGAIANATPDSSYCSGFSYLFFLMFLDYFLALIYSSRSIDQVDSDLSLVKETLQCL